jgi:hypothetical protein
MKYELAVGFSQQSLELCVKSMISNGWQPIGGVSVIADEGGLMFYQAMICQ